MAFILILSPIATASKVLLISLFTVRLVADVISGFFVAAMASTSDVVYVVAWSALRASCVLTYTLILMIFQGVVIGIDHLIDLIQIGLYDQYLNDHLMVHLVRQVSFRDL